MALVRWQPRTKAMDPFRDFFGDWNLDRFFDLAPARFTGVDRSWYPSMDVAEHEDHYFVKVDLPGMTRKDVELKLDDSQLLIRGERKQEEEQKKDGFYHCERTHGKFERTLSLPSNIQTDKVEANFKNGVLEIRIPKSEESKARNIEIKD